MTIMAGIETINVVMAVTEPDDTWEQHSGGRLHGTRGSVARMTPIEQHDVDVLEALQPGWKRTRIQTHPSQSGNGLT